MLKVIDPQKNYRFIESSNKGYHGHNEIPGRLNKIINWTSKKSKPWQMPIETTIANKLIRWDRTATYKCRQLNNWHHIQNNKRSWIIPIDHWRGHKEAELSYHGSV